MAGRYSYVPCMQCLKEKKEGFLRFYKITTPKLNEHSTFTCNFGHNCSALLTEHRYITLLHIALEDYINEYYRECIFNFSSAQERFFEYAIIIIYMDSGLSYEQIRSLWKFMNNQSERQLGAFYSLFFYRFKVAPFEIKKFEKNSAVRNNVVHKGESPSQIEAKQYGEFVIENINYILKFLCENIDHKIFNMALLAIQIESDKKRGTAPQGCISVETTLSIVSLQTCGDEEIKRQNRVYQFANKHPAEFAQFANEANRMRKIPDISNSGDPIFIDEETYHKQISDNAKFRGGKTFEEYIHLVMDTKKKYEKNPVTCKPTTTHSNS